MTDNRARGLLFKEKDAKIGGQSLGWNERFFVLEVGVLKYWENAEQALSTPAEHKGSMVLDEQTVLSHTKHARAGRFAFRLDRHASGPKKKFVLAAADLAQTEAWIAALREAGVADELRNEVSELSTGDGAKYRRSGGYEAGTTTRWAHQL